MGTLCASPEGEGRRQVGDVESSDDALFPLTAAALGRAGVAFREKVYAAGSVIFRAGEVPTRVHVLCSGAVELSRHERGDRVAVDVVRSREVFGDIPLLSGTPEPFDARTLEESHILSMASGDFLKALGQRRELAQLWLRSLALRARHLQQRLLEALPGDVEVRLARLLVAEAQRGEVTLSQAVMAKLLGLHRTSVSRALNEFKAAGLVELGYRRVRILDPERLDVRGRGPTQLA